MSNAPAPRMVAVDTETGLIAPGVIAPPLVCLTRAERVDGVIAKGLVSAAEAPEFFRAELASGAHIVGQNIAYDLLVLLSEMPALRPLIFAALDAGRVHDTMLAEQLLDIEHGCFRFKLEEDEFGEEHRVPVDYSLESIAKRRLGRQLDKGADGWRLRYLELLDVPTAQWPERARDYACDDAVTTLEVREQQEKDAGGAITNEVEQVRAAFALHCTGGRGVLVDLAAVDALEQELTAQRAAHRARLYESGIYRADGTRNMARVKELVEAAYAASGAVLPRTATGEVSTSAAVLKESGDDTLLALAAAGKTEKLLTAFVPGLRTGTNAPLGCRYNTLVESGRTSCRGTRVANQNGINMQQLPRA